MKNKNDRNFYAGLVLSLLALGSAAAYASAAGNTSFSQTITGVLGIDIVDGSGASVTTPTVSFSSVPFSMATQTNTATLGTATQKIRVTNPTSVANWTASIAATGGPAAVWQGPTRSYDFNDASGAGANGQMTIDPASGNIAGVGSTSTTNVSLGSSAAFEQGVKDSIDLISASAGAQAPGQWDLTGIGLSQKIPAAQAAEAYSIQMTLTVS